MKKSKLLIPLLGISTLAAAALPMTLATSCSAETNSVIPYSALKIDDKGALLGFKDGVDLSKYDTLSIPATVTNVVGHAFFRDANGDGLINEGDFSTIPNNIKNLVFEVDSNHISQCGQIEQYAFALSPFKNVKLALGIRKINDFAFSCSSVEQCYFPPYLNSIGEEAFSHTKLRSVAFNKVRSSYANPDFVSPWTYKDVGNTIVDSELQAVGRKAFYDCQDLVYLKPSLHCQYYIDTDSAFANGNSPFAIKDFASGESVKSNIKYLDLSDWWTTKQGEDNLNEIKDQGGNSLWFPAAFSLDMDLDPNETHPMKDNFIIMEGHNWEGNPSAELDSINIMRRTFYLSDITSLACPTCGDWYITNGARWGVSFDQSYDMEITDLTNWTEIRMREEVVNYTEKFPINIAPDDLEVTISNVKWDNGKFSGPNIECAVVSDPNSPRNRYLHFRWPGTDNSKLNGHSVTFNMTFKSEHLHYSYTYGPHAIYASDGTLLFEHDSSFRISFNLL